MAQLLSSGPLRCIRDGSEQSIAPINNVVVLIIDPQNDFHSNNSLAVPGAVEDSIRIQEMLHLEQMRIDRIVVTLDSHHRNHIAHACFWKSDKPVYEIDNKHALRSVDKKLGPQHNGRTVLYEPKEFSKIFAADIENGIWTPMDSSLTSYCLQYCLKLEAIGRHLTIWPEHCLIGTVGHCVVDNIQEKLDDWAMRRGRSVDFVYKSSNNLTEMYSAIGAAIPVPSDKTTLPNTDLLNVLFEATKLLVCGQALSHCVSATLLDIVDDWKAKGRGLHDIYLLHDGTSTVLGYEEFTRDFLRHISDIGVRIGSCGSVFPEMF